MVEAGLPKIYWTEAVNVATICIWNRCLAKTLNDKILLEV